MNCWLRRLNLAGFACTYGTSMKMCSRLFREISQQCREEWNKRTATQMQWMADECSSQGKKLHKGMDGKKEEGRDGEERREAWHIRHESLEWIVGGGATNTNTHLD